MIRSVAVLGAGTMGAQIAAHAANAGLSVLLLDVTPGAAREGLERASKLKPDPFFTPAARRLITTGGFDERLRDAGHCDWIIEAIVERLDAKQALFERLESCLRPDAMVSTNTSGLPIASVAEGRGESFRRRFVGTHFFNPPRYLPLLEVIPTSETDQAVTKTLVDFADRRLGKGVVIAKDEPGFIANRLGLFGMLRILNALQRGSYTIEEIDAMTGPAIGRPKSATFRTIDIAGLDVVASVARDLSTRLRDREECQAFALPPLVETMLERGLVGEKAGQGFYKRVKSSGGESEILVLDPATMEYRPQQRAKLGALEAAKPLEDVRERMRALFVGKNRVGEFLRETLAPTLRYAAVIAPKVAHSIDDVDRAMRRGFGWEIGPFETWAAIGADAVVEESAGAAAWPRLEQSPTLPTGTLPPAGPGLELLRSSREQNRVVRRNAGASLIDIGEGVLAVEFHSKLNVLGGDAIQMLHEGVRTASAGFRALVVGTEAPNFSAGANLMLLLLEAQEGNWDEIDLMIRAFQDAAMTLRCSPVPVVVAPGGLALGGGCEIVLHGTRVQAAAESYIGLVEVGVGLIPAGGGSKEMLARSAEALPPSPHADHLGAVQRVFETIAFGRVSTGAEDARRLGYLRAADGLTMNRERLIADARQLAVALAEPGYVPATPRTAIPVGGESLLAALRLGAHLAHRAGRISDHDAVVARKLAWVLAGGSLPHAASVSEQYLLDLEREGFLSLLGEPKTLERMQHMLKTGKVLRN